jgi:hypothetical protein
MTLLVGINLGSYVVLGADSRVSWYDGNKFRFRDEEEKIQRTNLGLVTGAGLKDLLDPVKEHLATDREINHTNQLEVMMREARDRFKSEEEYSDDRVAEALDTTCWLFSYYGFDPNAEPARRQYVMRLALAHPNRNYNRKLIAENSGIAVMPAVRQRPKSTQSTTP